MHDGRQQRLLRLLKLRLVTLVLVIAVVLLAPSVWGAFSKERESRLNKIEAEMQLAQLEARETVLSAEVEHLKTNRGMEGALRHQYEVGNGGEGVIYIVDRAASTSEVESEDQNSFSRWFKGFWPFW